MVTIINSDQEQQQYLKMLVYGNSGVGKTVFGSTAPDVLFLDAEAGMLSLKDKKVDKVKIKTFQDMLESFNFLNSEQNKKYKTVVIDSLTEIQKKLMDSILLKTNHDKPTIADWGTAIEKMRNMVRHFRDLPINVIFIALEKTDKDETSGGILKSPGLQGSTLPQEVMGFVDIVGYMVAEERNKKGDSKEKEIIRAIRVQPTASISAKDRSGKLGIWVKPDFKEIYSTIFPKPKKEGKK